MYLFICNDHVSTIQLKHNTKKLEHVNKDSYSLGINIDAIMVR